MRVVPVVVWLATVASLAVLADGKQEEDTTRDGTVIKWHSMSEVRRLQNDGKKMIIARIESIDARGFERRLEVVAAELRARGAEEALWIKRTPPADEDSTWLRWEGVPVATELFLVTEDPEEKARIYGGSETFTDLLTWLLAHLPPRRPRELESTEELEEFMRASPVSLVAYVPEELGGDGVFQEFVRKIARRHPYLPVGMVYPAESVQYEKHELGPISMYYRDEDHVFPLDEDRLQEMDDFTRDNALKKASHQFISRFPEDAAHIFAQGIDKIVFVFERFEGRRAETPSYLRELALEMRQRVVIAYVDYDDERMEGVRAFFGVEIPGAIRGFDARTERQYWPGLADAVGRAARPREVHEFVRDLAANKLTPHRKNEQGEHLEMFNADGATLKLNADTFEKTALNPALDTVVLFYATWCAHSKRFIGKYLQAGEESVGNRKVTFTLIDAELNDVETKTKIRLFPTVILFRKHTNEEVVYNGRRSVPEFLQWLDEQLEGKGKKEDPLSVPYEDETAKDYESPLKKLIKNDPEQLYTLDELDDVVVEKEEEEGGDDVATKKGKVDVSVEKTRRTTKKEAPVRRPTQLEMNDQLTEKVLTKLNVDRPTIVNTIERSKQAREAIIKEWEDTVAREYMVTEDQKMSMVGEEKEKSTVVAEEKEEGTVAREDTVAEKTKSSVADKKQKSTVEESVGKDTVAEDKKKSTVEEAIPITNEPEPASKKVTVFDAPEEKSTVDQTTVDQKAASKEEPPKKKPVEKQPPIRAEL